MASVKLDISDFKRKSEELKKIAKAQNLKAVNDIASEILRLSISGPPAQVPHDKGILQNSSSIEPYKDDEVVVGFNTEYAAYLHEHPEFIFQKGRKGKYLEDPIKNNLSLFRTIYKEMMGQIITP